MLHVIRFGTGRAPDDVMRSMFAARKAIFVDLLKWDVPIVDGAFEIDQFDDEHAHYLIIADPEGRHLGSARLLPTLRPHILGNFFPELCHEVPPRGERIYEVTRFCLDRSLRARARRAVRDTLVVALVDYALTTGIRQYSAIAEMAWLQQILAFGWRCRPLGLPSQIDGKMLGALSIDIGAETPRLLGSAGITATAALVDTEIRVAA